MKETLLSSLPPQVRNFVDPDAEYDALLNKVLQHLEANTQYKLSKVDIATEHDNGVKAINMVKNDAGKDKSNPIGGDKQNPSKKGNSENTGVASIVNKNNEKNKVNTPNPPQTNQTDSGSFNRNDSNFRGDSRGGYRGGRGSYRGYRGGYVRGNRGVYTSYGRGRGGYRGGGGYRGNSRDTRNVGYGGDRWSQNMNDRRCFICERKGHLAKDCWFRGRGSSTGCEENTGGDQGNAPGGGPGQSFQSGQTGIKCYNCRGLNHRADVCPSPRVF